MFKQSELLMVVEDLQKLNKNRQIYKKTQIKFKKYQETLKKEQEFWYDIFDIFEFMFEEKHIRIDLVVKNIRKTKLLKFLKENFENFELSDSIRRSSRNRKTLGYILTIF